MHNGQTAYSLIVGRPSSNARTTQEEPPVFVADEGYWASVDQDAGSVDPSTTNKAKAADQPATEAQNLTVIDPTTLLGRAVPCREWIVDEWLPVGAVTLSYGDGGVGKTLLSQQLMTSLAIGRDWLGISVTPCKVFAVFCEDNEGEVHRRQERINAALDCTYTDLANMRYCCPVGDDNVLVRFERDGSCTTTPRFSEILQAAREHRAKLVIIDTAADTFGGNENDRAQVRSYMGAVLGKLARDLGAAVLVNAHPSRSGMSATGDMDGGSTGWSNTSRSRWSLARPQAESGAAPDDNLRVLTKRKANYSTIGDTIELRWADGVLVPARQRSPSRLEKISRTIGAEQTFLKLLDRCSEQNVSVSVSPNASNFAPKVFAKRPERDGYRRQDFEAAMHSLFAKDQITNFEYGRRGDKRCRIGRLNSAAAEVDDERLLADPPGHTQR